MVDLRAKPYGLSAEDIAWHGAIGIELEENI